MISRLLPFALCLVAACAAVGSREPEAGDPSALRGAAEEAAASRDAGVSGEEARAAGPRGEGDVARADTARERSESAAPAPEDTARPGSTRDARAAKLAAGGSGAARARESARVAPGLPSPSRAYGAALQAPAMKAGRHDDNKEYNRFLGFLAENQALVAHPVDVSERLVLRTVDEHGKSLPNCAVTVEGLDRRPRAASVSYADGRTQFFPAAQALATDQDFRVVARCAGETKEAQLARRGRRELEVRFGTARALPAKSPIDIAIVIDTTGSMQSQIDRLEKTLRAIHFQLTQLPTRPDIRFGLVAYRDRGDEYVTQVTPFTSDVAGFQRALDGLDADGGGDTPEDLQSALERALHALAWREDAVRIGFVIADATAHTDYGQEFTYREAMRESLARGIKWVMVGAGGLGRDGEVVFRQIAQHTMGEYVFVTESAPGDSEGGVGEASHHVGSNYRTENLDQAIVRIVRRELSYLGDTPRDFDDTIVASGTASSRDEVLGPAVEEVVRQLADYSSLRLAPGTPIAVVPVTAGDGRYGDVAGYLTDRMLLAASRNASFKLVERDLQAVAAEMKLQLGDLFDVTETVPIGKLLGAEALVVARLTTDGTGAALFAKLIRVETGEVLSISRVEIAQAVLARS